MSRVGVIIPAGGAGVRLGGQPKAQLVLQGHPLLRLAIAPFLERPDVVQVVVALPAGLLSDPAAWLQYPRIRLVEGGSERMHSVRAALEALTPDAEIVVVHDAARPLVSRDLIARVIEAASRGHGAIAALPASDTIHEVDERKLIRGTLDRSKLWQAQTPQAFPRAMLVEAHRMASSANATATDDAALVLRMGGQVEVVTGERTNLKITVPDDIHLAEAILAQRT
jgi:2-C-methyl-D-erythritol 4-phosphate cytidylyltransferase